MFNVHCGLWGRGRGPTHFYYHRLQIVPKNLTLKNGQIGSGQFTEGNKTEKEKDGVRGNVRYFSDFQTTLTPSHYVDPLC